jgi:2'-5' RNA ligase
MAETIRTFIALELGPALVDAVRGLQDRLRRLLPSDPVRWSRPDQLHLTLKFLGQVAETQLEDVRVALARACQGVGPFELRLEGVGCFPDARRPRIVWVGLGGDVETLKTLQQQILQHTVDLGDHKEERPFHPHLTIGRIRLERAREARALTEKLPGLEGGSLGPWPVERVVLMRSHLAPQGASYAELAGLPLGGSHS